MRKRAGAAAKAAQVILRGSSLLEESPQLGCPMTDGIQRRNLFIAFGSGFYVLRYFLTNDTAVIVRAWHGRENRKEA
jgi:plasmid stabilization system protein ParE